MSPPGRPKGEYRSAQHEGAPISPPGRPKGEYRRAPHAGAPAGTADATQWRERRIAALLHYGTWLASALVAAGLLAQWLAGAPPWADLLAGVGIGLFIALPVLRVALMLAMFLHERDYLYSALALAVLAIIAAALAVGLAAGTG